MKPVLRLAIAVLAVFSLALASPASATHPTKGGKYVSNTDDVIKVNAKGTKIKQFFIFNQGLSQCSPMPFKTGKVKPKITRKGTFTWKGKLPDMLGKKRAFTINGKFSGPKGKKLKVTAVDKSCHTPKRSFKFTLAK